MYRTMLSTIINEIKTVYKELGLFVNSIMVLYLAIGTAEMWSINCIAEMALSIILSGVEFQKIKLVCIN